MANSRDGLGIIEVDKDDNPVPSDDDRQHSFAHALVEDLCYIVTMTDSRDDRIQPTLSTAS